MEPINIWAAIAVAIFIAVAVYTDLKWRRIPNAITVPAFACGLLFHGLTAGWSGLLMSLGGFATGFGVLLLLWLIGGGGGGDVKLMGAAGAWVGAIPILAIFIGSAVFAVLCTIAMMLHTRVNGGQLISSSSGASNTDAPIQSRNNPLKQHVPYAVPVAMSTACVIFILCFVTK
jgi:prepilin peptidase CpaA